MYFRNAMLIDPRLIVKTVLRWRLPDSAAPVGATRRFSHTRSAKRIIFGRAFNSLKENPPHGTDHTRTFFPERHRVLIAEELTTSASGMSIGDEIDGRDECKHAQRPPRDTMPRA